MKYVLGLGFAALLGGCAIAPAGNGDAEHNGNYLHRDYNDGYYHKFSYYGEHGNQGDIAGTALVDEMPQPGTITKKMSGQAPCASSTLSGFWSRIAICAPAYSAGRFNQGNIGAPTLCAAT